MAKRSWPALPALLALAALLAIGLASGTGAADAAEIRGARVQTPDHMSLDLSAPPASLAPANFRLTDARAPDVPIEIRSVESLGGNRVRLRVGDRLDAAASYRVEMLDPPASRDVRPAPWALLLTVVLSSALINNFVFTRYLGLCIFFGVSKKRDTAVGMGITFTLVMILSAMLSWGLFTFVMAPLKLKLLQIIISRDTGRRRSRPRIL